jgi:hypothetical protein
MNGQTISNSYMVTNRASPWTETPYNDIYPLPLWDTFYFWAPGANNPNSRQYEQDGPDTTGPMPSSYESRLEADIARAVQNGGRQVTVLIHGLSYVLSEACGRLGTYGQNLAVQGYKGLLVGFSWPSYGSVDSYLYYSSLLYSFPPAQAQQYGSIRDNIHGSTRSLLHLLNQLVPLCKKHGAQLNLLCHSEGNYMLMLAMYALSRNSDPALSELAAAGRFMDQVLMVAADINNGALEARQGSAPLRGQGSCIAQYSKTVTVYWSSADDRLSCSDQWKEWHNPSFPLRLGLHGLHSDASGAIVPNAYGLDCSFVAKENNPYKPPPITVHESYFYIPQILPDMKQALSDVSTPDVVNRVSTGNQSFRMTPAPSLTTGPFKPRVIRLPKETPVKRVT